MPGRIRASRLTPGGFAYGAALGLAVDQIVGDPRRGHPVAAFGRAAAAVEQRLHHDHRGWGALHTAVCAGSTVALGALAARAVRDRPAAAVALTAASVWAVVGGTTLGREARAIGGALAVGDLEVARERLPHLCGRDPQWGTHWHGSLESDGFRRAFLREVAAAAGRRFVPAPDTSFGTLREEQLDRLGDLIEEHADTDALLRLIEEGAPAGLPFVPPGAP
ncbi:Cobalamin biosynthesis protein CbiB [Streptomyces narbonensis]